MRTGSYPDSLIAMMSLLVMTMLLVQDYYKTRKTVEVSSVKLCHVCFTQIVSFNPFDVPRLSILFYYDLCIPPVSYSLACFPNIFHAIIEKSS